MPQDILLTEKYDLKIENGDLVISESTYQHQSLILLSDKGEFKENPTSGVGIYRYLEDYSAESLSREIREEFTEDGMRVEEISISNSKLNIKAEYE